MARSWSTRGTALALLLALGTWPATSGAAGTKKRAAEPGAIVTFVGFRQDQNGNATIYADLTESVRVSQEKAAGGELRYRIPNARVALRNNTNPLLAQHFGSIVESARLIPDKQAVVLAIKLRRQADAKHRVVDHAGGACTVLIEIPAAGAPSKQ